MNFQYNFIILNINHVDELINDHDHASTRERVVGITNSANNPKE